MSAALSPQEQAGTRLAGLFEEHGRMVYAVCRLVLRDSDEAEDAAQQTFLNAHGSLLAGTEPDDPAAWLAMIARNECRRRRRPPAVVVVPLDGEEGTLDGDPQQAVGRSEEIALLCQALTELPASQRQAVVLREFYGLSYAEVAAVLGTSGPAVESLIFKGRRRLQERVRPLRRSTGILFLPDGVRDALAATIPGFSSGSAAATGGLAAKVVALPLATKAAAVVLAVGVGSGIAASTGTARQIPGAGTRANTPAATTPLAAASLGQTAASVPAGGVTAASEDARTAQDAGDSAESATRPERPEPPEQRQQAESVETSEVPEPVEPAEPVEAPEAAEPVEPVEAAELVEPAEPVEAPEAPEAAEPAEPAESD